MQDIKFTDDLLNNNQRIPEECLPSRFAVSTNLICFIKELITDQEGVIILNYEPVKWNQWYPFYSTINDFYEFQSNHYGDLCNEFNSLLDNFTGSEEDRITKAVNEFIQLFDCKDVSIGNNPLTEAEYWLKFSKTQNVWTLYLIEFYCVTDVGDKSNLLDNGKIEQALIPLKDPGLKGFLETGKINNINVVNNTISLVSEVGILQEIKDNCILV